MGSALGAIRTKKRHVVPAKFKAGMEPFVRWIASVMNWTFLDLRTTRFTFFLGAEIHPPDVPKGYGRTFGITRLGPVKRVVARGKLDHPEPIRISIHLTPLALHDPLELATTVVHELQHAKDQDMAMLVFSRTGGFPAFARPLKLEARADRSVEFFWARVTEREVLEQYQRCFTE